MAGRKVFQPATVLTAADVNNFLMDQAVMVFADAAERDTEIPTPTEGMVTYLEDTNLLEVFTGASFVPVAEEADLTTLIPKSTVTTAGDLIVADGAGSVTRLGIGAADTVLTSDGTTLSFEAAGGGGGNYELITSGTLSSEALSIDSIPQDYEDLVLELSFTSGSLNIRVNDVTTSNFQSSRQTSGTTTLVTATGGSWPFNAGKYHRITFWDYTRADTRLAGEAWVKGTGDPTLKFLLGTSISFSPITKITTTAAETGTFALYGFRFE